MGTACRSTWKPGPALPLCWWRGWEETLSGLRKTWGLRICSKSHFGGSAGLGRLSSPRDICVGEPNCSAPCPAWDAVGNGHAGHRAGHLGNEPAGSNCWATTQTNLCGPAAPMPGVCAQGSTLPARPIQGTRAWACVIGPCQLGMQGACWSPLGSWTYLSTGQSRGSWIPSVGRPGCVHAEPRRAPGCRGHPRSRCSRTGTSRDPPIGSFLWSEALAHGCCSRSHAEQPATGQRDRSGLGKPPGLPPLNRGQFLSSACQMRLKTQIQLLGPAPSVKGHLAGSELASLLSRVYTHLCSHICAPAPSDGATLGGPVCPLAVVGGTCQGGEHRRLWVCQAESLQAVTPW